MKLLFDHNLSPRLAHCLADAFPGSLHISDLGLEKEPDGIVWGYAHVHDFVIVSKDSHFNDFGFLHGFPPKVVWIRLGNRTTQEIEAALRSRLAAIEEFCRDPEVGVLELT